MNRKLIALIALVALAGTGAFAQLAIGVTGAAYSNADRLTTDGFSQAWKDLRHGDGYFGFLVEVGMDKLAVGAAANASVYSEDWGSGTSYEMINLDGNLYLQGHLFRYQSFIDPFLELGLGTMAKDYRNEADDPDPSNPLLQSYYWDVGGGLGLNLGGLGFFVKGLYNMPIGDPATGEYKDNLGNIVKYDLAAFPISNLKFIFGAKIIF
jgi:hypothetical protein